MCHWAGLGGRPPLRHALGSLSLSLVVRRGVPRLRYWADELRIAFDRLRIGVQLWWPPDVPGLPIGAESSGDVGRQRRSPEWPAPDKTFLISWLQTALANLAIMPSLCLRSSRVGPRCSFSSWWLRIRKTRASPPVQAACSAAAAQSSASWLIACGASAGPAALMWAVLAACWSRR